MRVFNKKKKKRRNLKNVTMVTQARNFLTTHPIYRSFRNEDDEDYSHSYYEKQPMKRNQTLPLIFRSTIDMATEVINKEIINLMRTLLLLGNSLLLENQKVIVNTIKNIKKKNKKKNKSKKK